jgi:hypothetical protein
LLLLPDAPGLYLAHWQQASRTRAGSAAWSGLLVPRSGRLHPGWAASGRQVPELRAYPGYSNYAAC